MCLETPIHILCLNQWVTGSSCEASQVALTACLPELTSQLTQIEEHPRNGA